MPYQPKLRVMVAVRHSDRDDDWGWELLDEIADLSEAILRANAHPTKACVVNWHSKIEFDNLRPMPAINRAEDPRRV